MNRKKKLQVQFSPVPKLRKSPTQKMFKKLKKKLRKKRPRSEISSSQEIPFPAAGNTSDLTPEEPDVIPAKKSKSKKRRCACCKKVCSFLFLVNSKKKYLEVDLG